jgi:hypothetical protein
MLNLKVERQHLWLCQAAFDSVIEFGAAIIPAGTTLFGKFTYIKLHSGRVIAYNA